MGDYSFCSYDGAGYYTTIYWNGSPKYTDNFCAVPDKDDNVSWTSQTPQEYCGAQTGGMNQTHIIDNNCNAKNQFPSLNFTKYQDIYPVYKDVDAFDSACFASITGTVTHCDTQEPFTKAEVRLYFANSAAEYKTIYKKITVDEDGVYQTGNIPASTYLINARVPGYEGTGQIVKLNYNEQHHIDICVEESTCQGDCTRNGICDASCQGINGCDFYQGGNFSQDEIMLQVDGKIISQQSPRIIEDGDSDTKYQMNSCDQQPQPLISQTAEITYPGRNAIIREVVNYNGKPHNLVIIYGEQ